MTSKNTLRNRMNKEIHNLVANTYFEAIPLDEIFSAIAENEAQVVDEAGESWSGFLCGADGTCNIEIKMNDGSKSMYLRLSWHKMEGSGRYEVVAYVS